MTKSSISREVKIVLLTVFLVEVGLALALHLAHERNASVPSLPRTELAQGEGVLLPALEGASQSAGTPGYEAVVRTGIGADLLAGESRGRQGFVGSLYWAPLPTLLMLPFLAWPLMARTCFAATIIAAAALAVACAFLTAWWAGCRVPLRARIAGIALLCLCPWTILSVARGDDALLFGLLTLASVALTIRWLEKHALRDLAYLSVLMSLLILTRFQAVLLVAAVLFLILLYLLFQNPQKTLGQKSSYAEGTLIIFFAPIVYAVLVWLAANWLIMGDATFFLRGLFPSHWPSTAPRGLAGWVEVFYTGCEWHVAFLVAVLAALTWLMSGLGDRARQKVSPAAATVAVLASGLIFLLPMATNLARTVRHSTQARNAHWEREVVDPGGTQRQGDDEEVLDVLRYLVKHHAEDRVLVGGYRGYDLVRRINRMGNVPESAREMFVHTLSFYLGSALHDTRGKRLYLLIHSPTGGDRWEDIHLKYPDIYQRGVDFTVFEKGWKDWQLLEVVRTD
jgi:hypothetical protein